MMFLSSPYYRPPEGGRLYDIIINKTERSVEFSLRTIKICRFEIIDGVKYVYCIKHANKFVLREQVGFAAVL